MASTAATEAKKKPPTFSSLSISQATVTVLIKSPSKPPTSNVFSLKSSSSAAEHKFVIHKDFICYYSPFFFAAFNGNFEEGRTQTMTLVDVDPAFKVVVNEKEERPDLVTCAKVWLLGDRFLIRSMQNEAIKHIHAYLGAARGVELVEFGEFCTIAAAIKHEDNPLVRIVVFMMCLSKKTFDAWVDGVPHSILLPVAKALRICCEKVDSYRMLDEVCWERTVEKFFVKDEADKGKA
ncbi:hypothetical protein V8E51_002957 [Hyaloscypha variabilis]